MATVTTELEKRLYLTLWRIAREYQSSQRLLKQSWNDWGLDSGTEALEMAYENIQHEAKQAIRGVRLPKSKPGANP